DNLPVIDARGVTREIFEQGVGRALLYQIVRAGQPMKFTIVLTAEARPVTVKNFLRIVGLFYLALGLFILWRRLRAGRASHFATYCIASFVLFVYSYTGELTTVDWGVYWMSVAAMLLQPALFAHFCLSYPIGESGSHPKQSGRRWLVSIYGSAATL